MRPPKLLTGQDGQVTTEYMLVIAALVAAAGAIYYGLFPAIYAGFNALTNRIIEIKP